MHDLGSFGPHLTLKYVILDLSEKRKTHMSRFLEIW